MNTIEPRAHMYGLDHVMKMQGLSGHDLCRLLGKGRGYNPNVSNWRYCRTKASKTNIEKVSKVLNVPITMLLTIPTLADSISQLVYSINAYTREVANLNTNEDREDVGV